MRSMTLEPRIGGPRLFVVALGLCFVAVLAALAVGCHDGGSDHPSPLPAVQDCLAGDEASVFVTCHDWAGLRDDRQVQRARVESNNPRYCLVAGVCFYDCPPRP